MPSAKKSNKTDSESVLLDRISEKKKLTNKFPAEYKGILLVSSVFITGLPIYLYTTQIFPTVEESIFGGIYYYIGAIIVAITLISYGYTQYINNLIRLDTTNLHACIDVNSEKQFSADDLKKINVYRLYEVSKTLFTLNAYYLVSFLVFSKYLINYVSPDAAAINVFNFSVSTILSALVVSSSGHISKYF